MLETDFPARLALCGAEVQALLGDILSERLQPGEVARPPRLMAAMRHAALNGGKRLRPYLLVEAATMLGADRARALRAGAAIECIHCYSLVHDDLPAMDDDDMRRGQPTVHRAFDEATAILAGDSLLTLAFDLLADPATHEDPAIRAELVLCMARASGLGGMAGGQMMDIEAENRALGETGIDRMQAMKTGALIRCACESGAIIAGADAGQRKALVAFGEIAGRAFQLADDILDVTQSSEALGKAASKDAGRGKATLVSLLGIEESRNRAARLADEAMEALSPFGAAAAPLRDAARFIVGRDR